MCVCVCVCGGGGDGGGGGCTGNVQCSQKISRKLLNRYSTHVCSLIGILVSSQQWYLLVKMA